MSPIPAERIAHLKDALGKLKDLNLDLSTPVSGAALEFLLRETRSSPPEEDARPRTEDSARGADSAVRRAADWAGVQEQALLDLVDFADDGVVPTIYHGRLPKGKSERQRVLALVKLGLDKVAYGRDELSARFVNEICDRYECLDQNLPTNLQRSDVAKRSGSRGSYTYRLTLTGTDRARAVIRELLGIES